MITNLAPSPTPEVARASTRERILAAALDLFAQRGFTGTSVGDVETAAGLSPRSGALYKHFPSKLALLEAALGERMRAIEDFDRSIDLLDLGDLRAELTLVARWGLAELRRERQLARLVMKEGERVPEFSERFRDTIVRGGLALAAHVIERHGAADSLPDPAATAAALCSSLVGFSFQQTLFGDDFTDVDDERLISAWVDLSMATIEKTERSNADA